MRGFGSNERHAELAISKRPSWTAARARWPTVASKASGHRPLPTPRRSRWLSLDVREAELDRRQAELDAMAQRLPSSLADSGGVQDFQREASALENRRENLDRIEKLLASEQSDVERGRSLLEEERASFIHFVQAERQRLSGRGTARCRRSGQDPPRAQATFGRS